MLLSIFSTSVTLLISANISYSSYERRIIRDWQSQCKKTCVSGRVVRGTASVTERDATAVSAATHVCVRITAAVCP